MPIPESFLTELAERSDIVDVVGSYVRLEKRSGANIFGLCPFHSEKSPSFTVNPSRQSYHCFGCGKGGGVFNFIMEIEGLSFPDAVEFLAKRANMQMPEQENKPENRKRDRLLALNKDAARFFRESLFAPDAEAARRYMLDRGIGKTVGTAFGVGYAPNTWDSLRRAMKAKGYTDFDMFDAGLVRKGKNGGYYDVFRSRLMFPVIDVKGDVIGFSGRIIGDGEPKYMNSPETMVFNKSRNLFALNLAKKSRSGYIILSEGNIDVVSLHQAGFDSAVASLGTSLTEEQARLISRYTKQVIIAYDNDNAGINAAKRAIGILEKLDLEVKVLEIEGAKDPDEYIKLKGPEAFRKLLETSESSLDHQLKVIRKKYDLDIDEQKIKFIKEAVDLLAKRPNGVEREVFSLRLAKMTGMSADVISKEVERRRKLLLRNAGKDETRQLTRPSGSVQPPEKEIRYSDPASAVAEEGLIRLLYLDPAHIRRSDLPKPEDFSSPELGDIYRAVTDKLKNRETISTATMGAILSSEEMSLFVRLMDKPEDTSLGGLALSDYIRRIYERKREREQGTDPQALLALAEQLKNSGKEYKG